MAVISYKSKGQTLGHADWEALASAADGKLVANYGGLAVALWDLGHKFHYLRKFYFFPDPPDGGGGADADTIAKVYWGLTDSGVITPWKRRYEHQVFRDFVDALAPQTPADDDARPVKDDDWPFVRIGPEVFEGADDWIAISAHWDPLIWPPSGLNGGSFVNDALMWSLEAHQKTLNNSDGVPQPYYVFVDGLHPPEYQHRWSPAEIIIGDIGGSLSFPDYYNKYNIFRFSNLQTVDVDVDFGGHYTLTVPAMQSRCVRRTAVNGVYTAGYNYLQKPLAGDPWFFHWNGSGRNGSDGFSDLVAGVTANDDNCNITQPFVIAMMLGQMWNDPGGAVNVQQGKRDYRQFWDMSAIYNAGGYRAGPLERPTPAGGYCGPIANATPLGDLLFHRGEILVVHPAGPFRVAAQDVLVVGGDDTTQYLLRKNDGSIALGVEDVTVTRTQLADGTVVSTGIPAGSGADKNWELHSHLDVDSNIDYWYLLIFTRTTGALPRLSAGEKVQASFTHLTDDQKHFTQFDGMATLASRMADAGITLTNPLPGAVLGTSEAKQFQLEADDSDIIGMGTNLVAGAFGFPAARVREGGNALVFPYLEYDFFLDIRTIGKQTDTTTVTWVKWVYDVGTDSYTVDPDDPTFAETFQSTTWVNTTAGGAKYFSLYDTLEDLSTWLDGLGDEAPVTAEVKMTVFGPVVFWEQSVPVDDPGNGFTFSDPNSFYWFLESGNWVRRGVFPLGTGLNTGNAGWLNYGYGSPGGFFIGGIGPLGADDYKMAYPRFWRLWQDYRQWTHRAEEEPFFSPGLSQATPAWTSESPMVQGWFENKPVVDSQLRTVGSVPTHIKTGIGFVGAWAEFDVLTRLAAWSHFEVLTYEGNLGPLIGDYRVGKIQQTGYYTDTVEGVQTRERLLTNGPAPGADGGGTTLNVLTIEIEHFNAVASMVNHVQATVAGPAYVSVPAQDLLLGGFNAGGLGNYNWRPRTQWRWWDALDNPEVTNFLEDIGITPKTIDDMPGGTGSGSFSELLSLDVSYAQWSDEGVLTVSDTLTPDSDPVPLWDTWYGIHGGPASTAGDMIAYMALRYRWITVADAQLMFATLGVPFLHEELSVPARLEIQAAHWNEVDGWGGGGGGGGGAGPIYSKMWGFVHDTSGAWILDPDLDGDNPLRIRADCGPMMGWLIQAGRRIWDAQYGQGLGERFYNAVFPTNYGTTTQFIIANKAFLYKRYGSGKTTSVVYGRNYADYDRGSGTPGVPGWVNSDVRFGAPGLPKEKVPRHKVEGLDGSVEITELTLDENVITTALENGEFELVKEGRPLA